MSRVSSKKSRECSASMGRSDLSVRERGEKHIDMDGFDKTADKDIDLEGVPVDKGWAWVLLSGKYMYMILRPFTVNSIMKKNYTDTCHTLSKVQRER